MKLIEKPLNRASVAESCALAINMALAILKFSLEDSYLSALAQSLSTKGEQMQNSIATDKRKEKTEALLAADDLRDSLFAALKLILRAYIQWQREGITKSAKNLYGIISKHGLALSRENYEEEGALLDSMLGEFALAKNVESINATGIEDLVAALNEAQSNFNALYLESAGIEAGKEIVVSASDLKREVRALKIKTIDYLNVMNQANTESYGAPTAEVAELVNSLNQKIRNRK